MGNEGLVLRRGFIDFEEVYGDGWEDSQRNLYKYFVKSFGCRLIDAETAVPEDMVELLSQAKFRTRLRLSFAVNEDILILPEKYRCGFIGKGDLLTWASRSAPSPDESFTWNEHVSWLTIYYWYNRAPDGAYGSEWIANAKFIYLGSLAPLDEATRLDLIGKMRNCCESEERQ
ncbi:hypothetical protein [Aromatoleum petrolei]|uniref:Uncharacterized protein n=1 Tax=Aromatoleum petrolei TaxID=76116 RepID=A0ABX1MQM5_9RHOO|nr:hypothetical protein [Aromatoleum petrolei]NMF90230.1 hypothetical protein [Aromatoleum petrolei]QTQ35471.1 Uncharacterized protein ToN1_13070 [Aromatoleum petrolei]